MLDPRHFPAGGQRLHLSDPASYVGPGLYHKHLILKQSACSLSHDSPSMHQQTIIFGPRPATCYEVTNSYLKCCLHQTTSIAALVSSVHQLFCVIRLAFFTNIDYLDYFINHCHDMGLAHLLLGMISC